MGQPLLLVENLFSERQFPSHVITANEEPSGTEAFRVADGRRSPYDYWTPVTTNVSAWVKVVGNRLRAANMIALDRGHNLAGKEIELQYSENNFTTSNRACLCTIPSVAGGSLDDTHGVVTEEGAWLKRFATTRYPSATQWRLLVSAMGSDLKPLIVGLWVGVAWVTEYPSRPWGDDTDVLVGQETETDTGWVGTGLNTNRRTETVLLRLADHLQYDRARYHLMGHYGRGRPMWYVPDSAMPERAILVKRPIGGELGFRHETDYGYRTATFTYREHEPAP